MSQLPELPPCPFCGAVLAEKAPKSKYFIHPGNDCLLSHYEFDMNGNPDIARQWNVRAIASARREPLGIGKVREIERNHVYARTATLIDFTRAIEAEHGITGEPKHQQDGPESRASADTQGVHKVQESLPSALPIPVQEPQWIPASVIPERKYECTTNEEMISDSFALYGEDDSGFRAIGMGHYGNEKGWTCYGGDHDFMHVVKVTHYMQLGHPVDKHSLTTDSREDGN